MSALCGFTQAELDAALLFTSKHQDKQWMETLAERPDDVAAIQTYTQCFERFQELVAQVHRSCYVHSADAILLMHEMAQATRAQWMSMPVDYDGVCCLTQRRTGLLQVVITRADGSRSMPFLVQKQFQLGLLGMNLLSRFPDYLSALTDEQQANLNSVRQSIDAATRVVALLFL